MKSIGKLYLVCALAIGNVLQAETKPGGDKVDFVAGYQKLRDIQGAKNCFMGKPSVGNMMDCLATDLNFAPTGPVRAAAKQQIACGKAVADVVAVTMALPRICRTGAFAGGEIGAVVTGNPGGVIPGAVVGCGAMSLGSIAVTLPDVADCMFATFELQKEVKKAREQLQSAGSRANQILDQARSMDSQTDANCHRATGGLGPVSFENVRSSIDGFVLEAHAYANTVRQLANSHGYGSETHHNGLREAGDGFSHSGGHGGDGGGNQSDGQEHCHSWESSRGEHLSMCSGPGSVE